MTPDRRAQLYMTAAHVGAVATAVVIPAHAFGWPDPLQAAAFLVLLICIILLLRRRLRDEYIEGMWNSGVTFAFVAMLFWHIFAPFVHGMIDGFMGVERRGSLPAQWTGLVAIAAFFIAFHYRWLADRR